MKEQRRRGGIATDIGRGGARESSRHGGRNAEKAYAGQSGQARLPDSASPPQQRLPQQPPPHTAKGGHDDCDGACWAHDCVILVQSLLRPLPHFFAHVLTSSRLDGLLRPRIAVLLCKAVSLAGHLTPTTYAVQPQPSLTCLPSALSYCLFTLTAAIAASLMPCTFPHATPHRDKQTLITVSLREIV